MITPSAAVGGTRKGPEPHGNGQPRTGTASYLREMNRRAVFEEVRRKPQTRAQLAASTGLSKPTVSAALAQLEHCGLARPNGVSPGHSGPAADLYEATPTAGFVVGVQIDEVVQAVVADLAGTIVGRAKARNRVRRGATLAATVGSVADDAMAAAGVSRENTLCMTVSVPGVPHGATGSVRQTSLAGADEPGFFDHLHDALGMDFDLDNDINLAAVAEHDRGAARGVSDFVLLSLQPGVGMGAFVDGKLRRGVHGAAGEVAFLPVIAAHTFDRLIQLAAADTHEETMLDEAASLVGLLRLARRLGIAHARSAAEVFTLASAGDKLAAKAVRMHAQQVALTVTTVAAVLDPALIVINGMLDARVASHINEALRTFSPYGPAVVPGALGDDAVLIGTIATGVPIAIERAFSRSG